jgi:hypothetical protein
MNKDVCDFLVFLGSPPKELGDSGVVFRIEKRGVRHNNIVRFSDLRVVDLPVRMASSGFLKNALFGRPNVVNGLELDKPRECVINADLIKPLKHSGNPMVFAVLPDSFGDLADSFRQDEYFNQGFELGYMIREKESNAMKDLINLGRSRDEVNDIIGGSVTKSVEFAKELFNNFSKDVDAKVDGLKNKKQNNDDEPINY